MAHAVRQEFSRISLACGGQEWALVSGGCFLLGGRRPDEPARYVRFEDVKGDREAVRRIRWAQIKSADRAIEKIVRSYEQVGGGDEPLALARAP